MFQENKKHSGTKFITITNQIYGPPYVIATISSLSKSTVPIATGTFGWGNVHDEFPLESKDGVYAYFAKNEGETYFRQCVCGKLPSNNHSGKCYYDDIAHQYKFIWRKVR